MTKKELEHITKEGENEQTEFKRSFNQESIISISAFANTEGGSLWIGLSNNGELLGTELHKESQQNWLNEIKTKTEPSIIADFDVFKIDKKTIVRISVKEYPVKPISVKGRYYIRKQNSNHQLSVQEISDVYLHSMQYSWDSYPYQNADFSQLDEELIQKFILKVNKEGRFQLPDNGEAALKKLNLISEQSVSNAAMILFSKKNLRYNIHIGRFKSKSLIIADKIISGNLFSVLEESMQTIVSHLKFAFEIMGKTTQRNEIPEYPLEAIRELLVNAIVHRDYTNPTDIKIKIFDQE